MSTIKIDLAITGMNCASCANHVKTALQTVAGVKDATVNIAEHSAKISLNNDAKNSIDNLIAAVKKAGYEAVRI